MSTVVIKQILSTLVKLYSTSILLECRLHWRYAFTVAFGPLTNNTYLRKLKTEKEKTKLERKNQVFLIYVEQIVCWLSVFRMRHDLAKLCCDLLICTMKTNENGSSHLRLKSGICRGRY